MGDDDAVGDVADVWVDHEDQSRGGPAPTSCATMNIGTEAGSIPANVSLNARPMVTAGLAKLVEDVNQYAPAM